MFVIGLITGLLLVLLVLLNIYQYGQLREQRSLNADATVKLAKLDINIKDNEAKLAEMRRPSYIILGDAHVLQLANRIIGAMQAMGAPSSYAKRLN